MELEAKKRHIPFLTAQANIAKWNLYLEVDDFVELAYPIWRTIGNIATEDHFFDITVPEDGVIQLPDGCEFVKSVTTSNFLNADGEDVSGFDYETTPSGRRSHVTPKKQLISGSTSSKLSETETNGHAINWTHDSGIIRVTSPDMVGLDVRVVYKAISVDSDGLPLLDDKELNALTYNVALVLAEQDLFRKIPGADALVKYLSPLAERALAAAKIPEKISDDALNRALDIKTSRDYKTFGRDLKFK
jgi:hypothetical protein